MRITSYITTRIIFRWRYFALSFIYYYQYVKKKKKKYSWNAWILNRKLTDRDIRIFIFNIDRKYSLEQLLKQIIKKQFNNKK